MPANADCPIRLVRLHCSRSPARTNGLYRLNRKDNAFLRRRLVRAPLLLLLMTLPLGFIGSCATIRVTDPQRSATEEFLENVATTMAVDKLATSVLRDRKLYIETTYLNASRQPSNEHQYLLGELRSKLLLNGVRLVDARERSEIVMEVRSQGISIDRV